MDLLAPFSRNIVAPLWAAWERSPYLKHYRQLLKTQYDPPETLRQRQHERLAEIIRHAFTTCRFWKKRLEACGLTPDDIRTVDDLSKLPLLSKADLRNRLDEMISSDYPDRSQLIYYETSGSTGKSVVGYADEACEQFRRGAVLRSDEWSGWRRGERIAALWSYPERRTDWRGRLRELLLTRNYLYLDTLKMGEDALNEFADQMVAWPPSLIFGHAHSFYLFARFLKQKRPDVRIRPKGIITTAMVLYDHERPLIEEVFQCKVTNRYGCEEVSLIACECEKHEGLHVNADSLYVELIDFQGNPCLPGQPGRVIITDLWNRAMPMLRYEVGDTASWAEKPCSCGRTLPLFERVEGRVADYVMTKDGNFVSGISLTSFFACMLPGFSQIQIIQEEVDRFVFNLVKGADYTPQSLDVLDGLVQKRFGDDTRYETVFMNEIPREASGKYRFCISKVEKKF